jgi:hypothetical protein
VTRPEDAKTHEFATDGKTDELPASSSPADSKTVNFAGPQPDGQTVAFPVTGRSGAARRGPAGETVALAADGGSEPRSGFWRELSGALAGGVVVLAAIVLVLEVISWSRGVPGLGWIVLVGHVVGAVLAVVAQRQLDRRVGRSALVAGLALGVVVVAVLVLFWWS